MIRLGLSAIVLVSILIATAGTSVQQQPVNHRPSLVAAAPSPRDGRHDFDFLHGTWRIHNRWRAPLSGSNEWLEFNGRSVERPLWNGQANLEEYDATRPNGGAIHGLALRLYDPKTAQWTIHWSNAANGTLDPPMTGTFRDGVGEFLGHDSVNGRTVLVRFLWTNPKPGSARWEQAYSADSGRTWETNWIMDFTRTGDISDSSPTVASPDKHCCPVIELRQYDLHPGKRETLIGLFEREFIESQEAVGVTLVGQFRDLDRPNVFTWIRGFADMESRPTSLNTFYSGPVWKRYRDSANATMVNSDNVRLLHPVGQSQGFTIGARPVSKASSARGLIVATIYTLAPSAAEGFAEFFEQVITPVLEKHGATPIAVFETDQRANNFPRLPVREGERAFVWFARFADAQAHDRAVRTLAADSQWKTAVIPELERRSAAPVETLRLTPTERSRALP